MEKRFLKTVVALILIMTLTMSNFVFLGTSFVSYALDSLNQDDLTNNKNIKYNAYFKDSNGDKIDVKDAKISGEDIKLYLGVSVQNEGYFNGNIEILNSNFKLKDQELSEGINKIEENKISLNQIRAGETVEIELNVEALQGDIIDSSLLNMESEIKLTGTYTDSKAKKIKIESIKSVKLILNDPYEDGQGANLKAEVITNKIYNINGENKRLVQIKVNSKIDNNKYPVKQTQLELSVPEETENVKVISLGTNATNGKGSEDFTEENWQYLKDENKIKILIENKEEDGKITWNKNAEDKLVVTYILPEKTSIENKQILVKNEIELYNINNSIKSAEGKISIGSEKDGTLELNISNTENKIYKGKIYAKQQREYTTKVNVNINYPELADKIELDEKQATYVTDNTELTANVQYIATYINKQKMEETLGHDGIIEIFDLNGNILAKVKSTADANKDGKIEIKYNTGVKGIIIKTSKPENTGILELEHKKVIAGENYTTEELSQVKELKEDVNLINNQATYTNKIALNETTTKAKLNVNKNSISTINENKGLELKATLLTNNEKYDLYKNPTIKIELPSQVESVKVNSVNLLYENELKIKNVQVNENSGIKVIEIALDGEQTKYLDSEISEGATIIANIDLTLNKKVASSSEKIKMAVENQKAISYENNSIEKTIEIIAPTGMVVANTMENSNLKSVGENNTETKLIGVGKEAKQEEVKIDVINNNDAEVTNVKVLGKFPTKNKENTIDAQVINEIKTQGIDTSKVKIYYSEKEDATAELTTENQWKDSITDNKQIKSYLITVNNMQQGEGLTASYGIQIPEGLKYNEKAYQTYEVNYNDTLTGKNENVKSTKLGVTTGKGPELTTTMTATVGGEIVENNAEVLGGEKIKYTVKVENTGSEDVANAILHLNIPEGTDYLKVRTCNGCAEAKGEHTHTDKLTSIEDKKINLIKAGESIEETYEVVVKSTNANNTNISNIATVQYGEVSAKSNQINLTALKGDLSIELYPSGNPGSSEVEIREGYGTSAILRLTNTSSEDKQNLKIELSNDSVLKIEDIYCVNKDNISVKDNVITIKTLKSNETENISIGIIVRSSVNTSKTTLKTKITSGNDVYRAPDLTINIKKLELQITQTSDNADKYVKEGDNIIYTIKMKNASQVNMYGVGFIDEIPNQLTVLSIEKDGKVIDQLDQNKLLKIDNYIAKTGLDLKAGEETTYKITTVVETGAQTSTTQKISNIAKLSYGELSIESEPIVHYMEGNAKDNNGSNSSNDNNANDNNNNSENNNNSSNVNNPNKENTYSISGTAWFDKDENGEKGSDEELLKDITVRLVDLENNTVKNSAGEEITTKTNDEGFYSLDNVPAGKYIVVFEYDTSKYMPTSYKVEGISDSKNSKVVLNTLNVDGKETTVANTDTLIVADESISNINIGLKEIKTFELKLDKNISKVVVQNSKETKTYDFNNTSMTKIELPSKYMKNTNMIIEYEIKVTNIGEAEGYVKSIVDYLPSGLKFNSELNKDWYQLNSNAYNTSLANEKILPGESKTVKIVLTKNVTSENSEIVNNVAEIAESYSPSGIESKNSKANNKVQGESDMSNADIIIGIATGEIVVNVALISILSIIVIISGAYIINKKFIKFRI